MEFKRCYGCMRELDAPGAVCPHCGFDNSKTTEREWPDALPCGTILAGQYITGQPQDHELSGITYLAYDLKLEQPVFIRELFPVSGVYRFLQDGRDLQWNTVDSAEWIRGFTERGRRAARLRNTEHIAAVQNFFYENKTAYIVTDYAEGETLDSRRQDICADGEKRLIELLLPVMRELEDAHKHGVIHCGITPKRLLLRPDGSLVLTGLGTTEEHIICFGDHDDVYIPNRAVPENAIEYYSAKKEPGPWTDVYGICATIYDCVADKPLPRAMERLSEVMQIDFEPFRPAVAQTLEAGLALRAKDRIQSVKELRKRLEAALRADEDSFMKMPGCIYGPPPDGYEDSFLREPVDVYGPPSEWEERDSTLDVPPTVYGPPRLKWWQRLGRKK